MYLTSINRGTGAGMRLGDIQVTLKGWQVISGLPYGGELGVVRGWRRLATHHKHLCTIIFFIMCKTYLDQKDMPRACLTLTSDLGTRCHRWGSAQGLEQSGAKGIPGQISMFTWPLDPLTSSLPLPGCPQGWPSASVPSCPPTSAPTATASLCPQALAIHSALQDYLLLFILCHFSIA